MSEPTVATGKRRAGACLKCGEPITEAESVGAYEGASHWRAEPHSAPCGLPCFGAGAQGREGLAAYRAGQMHGLSKAPCPGCSVPEPTGRQEPTDSRGTEA